MTRVLRPRVLLAALALLALGGGSAIAAKKYVVDSKKDIAPKVRKALKGKRGKTGATGPQGPQGTPGAQGAAGPSAVLYRAFEPVAVEPGTNEWTTLATIELPPGDWILDAGFYAKVSEFDPGFTMLACGIGEATGTSVLGGVEEEMSSDQALLRAQLFKTFPVEADNPVRSYALRCSMDDAEIGEDFEVDVEAFVKATLVGLLDAQVPPPDNS